MKLYLFLSFVFGFVVLVFSAANNKPATGIAAREPMTAASAATTVTSDPGGPDSGADTTTIITGNERLLGIERDVSGSGNEGDIKTMTPNITRAIRSRADSIDGVAVIRVGNGSRSVLVEPVEIFRWGRLDIKSFVEPGLENAPLDVRLFADRKQRYIAQARAKYDQEKERLIHDFYARVDRELERLSTYLVQPPAERAPCTRFASIAARLERDNYPFDILITDGWRDCPEERNRQLAAARISGKLVVIQLTRVGDSVVNESELRTRESFLRQLFPTADVIPAYMAGDAVDFLFR